MDYITSTRYHVSKSREGIKVPLFLQKTMKILPIKVVSIHYRGSAIGYKNSLLLLCCSLSAPIPMGGERVRVR
jgi:hypothetical protein